MIFFKTLFGKNKTGNEAEKEQTARNENEEDKYKEFLNKNYEFDNSPDNFEKELDESFKRYYSIPDLRYDINLTADDGTVYKPHEAFDGTFSEWKKIHSKWDRLSLLFDFWDETELNKLQKWQILERFIKDRQALKALDFLKTRISNQELQVNGADLNDINLMLAISKLHRILMLNGIAKSYAEKAYTLRPDLDTVKIEYATVLHQSEVKEERDLAHKLYDEVMVHKIFNNEVENVKSLLDFFIFSKDYIDSDIYAITCLLNEDYNIDNWNSLSVEYYYSPFFRRQHAVMLIKQKDFISSLAKLNSLTEEFPWYKEGLLTTKETILAFREKLKKQDFMASELERIDHYLNING